MVTLDHCQKRSESHYSFESLLYVRMMTIFGGMEFTGTGGEESNLISGLDRN